nr:RNA-directed DNA polymerase, eukaryota, reverse transcriptase zinc-binding domain protein [Tanacetum cinerariifolium]
MGKKEENGGFTPSGRNNGEDGSHTVEEVNDAQSNCCENPNVKGSGNGSISSGHFKVSEVPNTGGSMIDLLEEVVKFGQKNSPNEGSNALIILMNKLRFLKKQIRIWNKDSMGCRRKDQTQLKKILEKMDSVINSGKGNDVLIKSCLDTIHQIQNLDRIDALEFAQKAKIKWAIDGDENSGFYHGIINKRRSIQSIRGVMVEGMWIDEPVKIDSDQRSFLERDVSNLENKKAVWECGMDKALGPDGFSFGFFRHFWYLVDGEVYEAVRYFFTHFDLPKGSNSSFIALVPKIPDANMVKDFRPISLISSIYKIIAKILTNHLVGVLGGIINEVQSAFIEDRQILDGPFILNEVFAWCKRKKTNFII